MRKVAGRLKLDLSQYRDLEAFAQFGSDLDPETQRTLARGERLVRTLNQGERQPLPIEDQVIQIYAATNGYLDRIEVERVPEFLNQLTERVRTESDDLRGQIREGKWDDSIQEKLKGIVEDFASDFGYDLDEEGNPEDSGEEREQRRARQREGASASGSGESDSNGSSREGDEGEGSGEAAEERETANA
jgi:F-type H+-transporting ATPase subunit alpha